jgi:protoporphyrinogen oxidase
MSKPIIVIGGGVSGLIAGIELKRRNIPFILLEQSTQLGGRVQSDQKDGFMLDRGFQVLQTAYPEAKNYLDYDKLNLKKFKPGAKIFCDGNWNIISDPFRDFGAFFETVFSGTGTVRDKWLVLKLRNEVKGIEIDNLFKSNQISTVSFLKSYGFTDQIIKQFFIPFFSGIFLEQDLSTSADAFKFIYKMFTEGDAAIPAKGMGEISKQLAAQLNPDSIRLQTAVKAIDNNTVILSDGTRIESEAIILAGSQNLLYPEKKSDWNGTDCIYMQAPIEIAKQPYLLLNGKTNRLINHIAFISDISEEYAPKDSRLVSISLSKQSDLEDKSLEFRILIELRELFGDYSWKWIKRYSIPKSLPVKTQIDINPIKLSEYVYSAGDVNYFGSLNYAMKSGREAVVALNK